MNQNLQDRLYERQVMSIINYCKSNYEKMTEKELIQKIYKEKRFDYGFIKEKVELYYFIKNEWEPFKEKLNKEVI